MTPSSDLRVLFRVAAGPRRGFGHLVRCISLARAMGIRPLLCLRGPATVVETAIVKRVEESPQLPTVWGTVDSVRGMPRGFFEQRTLYFRPGTSAAHHRVYFEQLVPALERDGARLQTFFDTVIGPGTTNTGSHRSIELRRFPDMASWQRWREAQESDRELATLVKEVWLSKVERVESVLLYPLDYSRMR